MDPAAAPAPEGEDLVDVFFVVFGAIFSWLCDVSLDDMTNKSCTNADQGKQMKRGVEQSLVYGCITELSN